MVFIFLALIISEDLAKSVENYSCIALIPIDLKLEFKS